MLIAGRRALLAWPRASGRCLRLPGATAGRDAAVHRYMVPFIPAIGWRATARRSSRGLIKLPLARLYAGLRRALAEEARREAAGHLIAFAGVALAPLPGTSCRLGAKLQANGVVYLLALGRRLPGRCIPTITGCGWETEPGPPRLPAGLRRVMCAERLFPRRSTVGGHGEAVLFMARHAALLRVLDYGCARASHPAWPPPLHVALFDLDQCLFLGVPARSPLARVRADHRRAANSGPVSTGAIATAGTRLPHEGVRLRPFLPACAIIRARRQMINWVKLVSCVASRMPSAAAGGAAALPVSAARSRGRLHGVKCSPAGETFASTRGGDPQLALVHRQRESDAKGASGAPVCDLRRGSCTG